MDDTKNHRSFKKKKLRLHIVCRSVLILKFYLMSTLSHQQRRTQGASIHEVARVHTNYEKAPDAF